MRIAVVIQARTGSSRLPGKVLSPIGERPLLALMCARVKLAREPDTVVVATSVEPADDAIAELCASIGIACVRGDALDCLARHVQAGIALEADAVAKIPSDCPLIDPGVIDLVLRGYRDRLPACDYFGNLQPPSWPDGNDVEVMSLAALRTAAAEACDPFDREHTTPYLWSRPERFRSGNVRWPSGLDYSRRYRWVVDWEEDLALVRAICAALEPRYGLRFGVDEVLGLHRARPELERINAQHRGYHYTQTRAPAQARG